MESAKSAAMNRFAAAFLADLTQYGPFYLTDAELKRRLREVLDDYHRFLAVSLVRRRDKAFWDYHRSRLQELGESISRVRMLKVGVQRAFREVLNPGQAVQRCWRHVVAGKSRANSVA
jgi:hypothetical protein